MRKTVMLSIPLVVEYKTKGQLASIWDQLKNMGGSYYSTEGHSCKLRTDLLKLKDVRAAVQGPSLIFNRKKSPRNWWCKQCKVWVSGKDVTFRDTHDERRGGCGGHVV